MHTPSHPDNRRSTVDRYFELAQRAIVEMQREFTIASNKSRLKRSIQLFEDVINGMSGNLLGLEAYLLDPLKQSFQEIVDTGTARGVEVRLFYKLLPTKVEKQTVEDVLAKKLYPLTTNIRREKGLDTYDENNPEAEAGSGGVTAKKLYPRTTTVKIKDGYILSSEEDEDAANTESADSKNLQVTATIPSDVADILGFSKKIDESIRDGSISLDGFAKIASEAGVSSPLLKSETTNQINSKIAAATSELTQSAVGKTALDATNARAAARAASGAGGAGGAGGRAATPVVAGQTTGTAAGGTATTAAGATGGAIETLDADVTDDIFAAIDAETEEFIEEFEQTPGVLFEDDPDDLLPVLPSGLMDAANTMSSGNGSLESGLSTVFVNPLATIIQTTKDYLLSLTGDNFTGMNAALSGISTGANYGIFQAAVGGGDGLGGAVAQLDAFLDHTNRLSGLAVDNLSESAAPSVPDNTIEDTFYQDLAYQTPTTILSFDARKFRSAKYYVQATAQLGTRLDANTDHQSSELFVLHDNRRVYFREVHTNYTIDPFIGYTANLSGNVVSVIASSNLANTDIITHGIKLQIATPAESYDKISLVKMLDNHEILTSFYNDDTDYIGVQTASLQKDYLVNNLYLEVLNAMTALKSGGAGALLTKAAAVNARAAALQSSIDADYQAYKNYTKKAEALDLMNSIMRANDDPNGQKYVRTIINSSIRSILDGAGELQAETALDDIPESEITEEEIEDQIEEIEMAEAEEDAMEELEAEEAAPVDASTSPLGSFNLRTLTNVRLF